MNLEELRSEAWDIAREVATNDADRLWNTKEMNRYINRVYKYIAKETLCIRDDITASICRIPVSVYGTYADLQTAALTDAYAAQDLAWFSDENSWFYVDPLPAIDYATRLDTAANELCPYSFPLDSRILDIEEIKWTYSQWRLTKVSAKKWQVNPYWEQVKGMSTEYATDLATGRLNLNFRNTTSDTLRLVVRRLPLVDLVLDTDTPEFRVNYHELMINGILHQMYMKQDAQAFDMAKASDYLALYKADIDEIKQQEHKLDNRLRPNYSMDGFR